MEEIGVNGNTSGNGSSVGCFSVGSEKWLGSVRLLLRRVGCSSEDRW